MNHLELIILFHELGHAIHFISSNVKYPTYCALNLEFDFMEVTSKLVKTYNNIKFIYIYGYL